MRIATVVVVALFSTSGLIAAESAQGAATHYDLNIPREPLDAALKDLAQQTGLQVGRFSDAVSGDMFVGPVAGDLSVEQALKTLLESTRLTYRTVGDHAVIILRPEDIRIPPPANTHSTTQNPANSNTEGDGKKALWSSLRLAQTAPQSPAAVTAAAPSTKLDEITVTATRREESLSKVPISLSAFTQESMDIQGIRDFTDIARFTPGVQMDTYGTNRISIRGIGSSGGAGTTGIYIDDTPIQMRAMGVNADDTLPKTFDISRVEVLRGPQGTLFGAGSEGGTVRYITTQPSLTQFSTYARSEVSYTQGGAPNYEAGLAVGGPIIDQTLGFRVSAWTRRDGGWIDRIDPNTLQVTDKNANHDQTTVLRAALTWAPNAAITVAPSILFQDRQRDDVELYWPLYSRSGSDKFVSANFSGLQEPDRYVLPALKITADIGSTELVANSSYFRRRDISGYDGTLYNMSYYQTLGWPAAGLGLPGPPCTPQGFSCYPLLDGNGVHLPAALDDYRSPNTVTNQQDTVSQELRLQSNDPAARVQWTVGAFFSISRSFSWEQIHDPIADQLFEYLYGTTIANAFGTPANPDGSSYLPYGDSYFNKLVGHDRQLAGFTEIVWGLTDQLKLTTGVRYSKTDFSFAAYNDGPQNYGPGGGNGASSQKPVTERLELSFQQDRDHLYYATYSTGFRVGGANSTIPPGPCDTDFERFGISGSPTSYKSDTVKNFEVGTKDNFNSRLRIAGSLYYIKWDDIQQTVTLPTCGLSYVANLGAAVSKGGDLQADVAVTAALTLESAVGYTDAYYSKSAFPGPLSTTPLSAVGDAIVGQNGNSSAPWTFTLGAEYKFRAFGDRESFIRADVEHETKNTRMTAADDPSTVQYGTCTTAAGAQEPCYITPPSTTFVSMRAGSTFAGCDISLFVDNLLDSHPVLNYNYQPTDGFAPQTAPSPLYRYTTFRPRTFGITLTYRH